MLMIVSERGLHGLDRDSIGFSGRLEVALRNGLQMADQRPHGRALILESRFGWPAAPRVLLDILLHQLIRIGHAGLSREHSQLRVVVVLPTLTTVRTPLPGCKI